MMKLRELKEDINNVINSEQENIDSYTKSHLQDAVTQIEKALEANYIYKVM